MSERRRVKKMKSTKSLPTNVTRDERANSQSNVGAFQLTTVCSQVKNEYKEKLWVYVWASFTLSAFLKPVPLMCGVLSQTTYFMLLCESGLVDLIIYILSAYTHVCFVFLYLYTIKKKCKTSLLGRIHCCRATHWVHLVAELQSCLPPFTFLNFLGYFL